MATYRIAVAKSQEYLSQTHSGQPDLATARSVAGDLFGSREFDRVSVWRVDADDEETWIESYVRTMNAGLRESEEDGE